MSRPFKIVFRIVLGIGVFLVIAVLALVGLVWQMSRPTAGPAIAAYALPQRALLVIDVQEDYTGPNARKPFRDGPTLVATSNRLLERSEALGLKVVFIRNEFSNPLAAALAGGLNAAGAPGTRMDARLFRAPGAVEFPKDRSDAFSNADLDAYLRKNEVKDVVVVGLDGAYCVNATVGGARNRGYGVTVISDGVATESSTALTELFEKYKAVGATVVSSAEYLQKAGPAGR